MQKSKIKNLICGVILILLATVLAGCANVDYSRFVYPTGEITDKLVVELDAEKIAAAHVSLSKVSEQILNDMETLYIQPVRDFKDEYAHSTHTAEQKKLVSEGITYGFEMAGDRKIVATISFSSIATFNLFYNVSENTNKQEPELREGTFINRYVQSSQNAFAVLKTKQLKQLVSRYESMFDGNFRLGTDVKLTQVYASPKTDIKSNAHETEISQGIKMHQWEISPENLDFALEFYTISAKTGSWYILALFITFLVVFVVYCNIRTKHFKGSK